MCLADLRFYRRAAHILILVIGFINKPKDGQSPFCFGFDAERWFCPGVLMLVGSWPHLRLASKLF